MARALEIHSLRRRLKSLRRSVESRSWPSFGGPRSVASSAAAAREQSHSWPWSCTVVALGAEWQSTLSMRAAKQQAGQSWGELSPEEKRQLIQSPAAVPAGDGVRTAEESTSLRDESPGPGLAAVQEEALSPRRRLSGVYQDEKIAEGLQEVAQSTSPVTSEPGSHAVSAEARGGPQPRPQHTKQEATSDDGTVLIVAVLRDVLNLGVGVHLSVQTLVDDRGEELPYQPLVVDAVDEGSAAAAAGVQQGDELLSIDGAIVGGDGEQGLVTAETVVMAAYEGTASEIKLELQRMIRSTPQQLLQTETPPPPSEGKPPASPRAVDDSEHEPIVKTQTQPGVETAAAKQEADDAKLHSVAQKHSRQRQRRRAEPAPSRGGTNRSTLAVEDGSAPWMVETRAKSAPASVLPAIGALEGSSSSSSSSGGGGGGGGGSSRSALGSNELVKALEEKRDEGRKGCWRKIMSYVINPRSRGKRCWDIFMLLMVLFSSLYEPFKAAFLPIDRAMSGWEWFVDATFYADILLSFWTGFDRGYEVVMARQEIFKNYLTGWFAVDLLATVEWDLLGGALIRLATAGNAQQEGHTALLRLTRLLKVVRIVKGPRLILNLTKTTTIHTAYIDAAQFFALVLIVAHNLGCFFFMVPALFMDCVPALYTVSSTSRDNEASWFGGEIGERIDAHLDPGCNGVCGICRESAANGTPVPTSIGIIPGSWRDFYDIEQQPPPDQYVDALYWSLTTMTTIGYGDESPQTWGGRLIAVFYLPITTVFFCNLVGALASKTFEEDERLNEELVQRQFGDQLTAEELRMLCKVGAEATCTYHEYVLAMMVKLGKIDQDDIDSCRVHFAKLDRDGDGSLTVKDLSEKEMADYNTGHGIRTTDEPDEPDAAAAAAAAAASKHQRVDGARP